MAHGSRLFFWWLILIIGIRNELCNRSRETKPEKTTSIISIVPTAAIGQAVTQLPTKPFWVNHFSLSLALIYIQNSFLLFFRTKRSWICTILIDVRFLDATLGRKIKTPVLWYCIITISFSPGIIQWDDFYSSRTVNIYQYFSPVRRSSAYLNPLF